MSGSLMTMHDRTWPRLPRGTSITYSTRVYSSYLEVARALARRTAAIIHTGIELEAPDLGRGPVLQYLEVLTLYFDIRYENPLVRIGVRDGMCRCCLEEVSVVSAPRGLRRLRCAHHVALRLCPIRYVAPAQWSSSSASNGATMPSPGAPAAAAPSRCRCRCAAKYPSEAQNAAPSKSLRSTR